MNDYTDRKGPPEGSFGAQPVFHHAAPFDPHVSVPCALDSAHGPVTIDHPYPRLPIRAAGSKDRSRMRMLLRFTMARALIALCAKLGEICAE
jgi:hypothetical protein